MRNTLSFLVVVFWSCSADDLPRENPACVDEFVELAYSVDRLPWAVRTQVVDGRAYYWLDTDALSPGGGGDSVGEACDTVCTVGGAPAIKPCTDRFDSVAWEVIWPE